MPLTVQQLLDLRSDLGDLSKPFGDPELSRFYDRVSGAADEASRLEAVKALAIEGLLNSATKLHDYTAGATGEKLSQVRAHLKDRFADYKPLLDAARGQKREFGFVGLRSYPHVTRTVPSDDSDGETGALPNA